jgi:2-polyprenyl-3-methyl-5-hydroxy-6-metoxy-1,4-benzoquinol methylase
MDDALSKYYEKAFREAGEGGSHYNEMSVLELAGHNRKSQLLAELDLPDLQDLVVLDYGMGSWGFACVFPELKRAGTPIGIDVSDFAVLCSSKLAKEDPDLQGKSCKFLTSTGYDIRCDDASVDIAFCGEVIEHIEDTEAFLSEIWRLLKPGGYAIFTTPNRSLFPYRQLKLSWAMGLEHVALMDHQELREALEAFFSISAMKGYNSTIHPALDGEVSDAVSADEWAKSCEDDPENASGLVALCRKEADKAPKSVGKYTHEIVGADELNADAGLALAELYEDVEGIRVPPNESLKIPVPKEAVRANLILWSHPWSGIVEVSYGDKCKQVDLYSHVGGCQRLVLNDLRGCEEIRVSVTGDKRPASMGAEAILFRCIFSSPV